MCTTLWTASESVVISKRQTELENMWSNVVSMDLTWEVRVKTTIHIVLYIMYNTTETKLSNPAKFLILETRKLKKSNFSYKFQNKHV